MTNLKLKDLGRIKQFLRANVIRKPDAVSLSKYHYTQKTLEQRGTAECTPANSPMDPGQLSDIKMREKCREVEQYEMQRG